MSTSSPQLRTSTLPQRTARPLPKRPLPGKHTPQAARGRELLLHRETVRAHAPVAYHVTSSSKPLQRLPWWRRSANLLLGAMVAVVTTLVTAVGSRTGPMRFDDEGTYVSQAMAVLDGQLAPYTYWYDHPPFGWIVLAGWMGTVGRWFPGENLISSGRGFMVALTFVSTVCVVMIVRRLGGTRVTAVAAGLVFGLSPLAVQYHRMVLLDNIAVTFLLLAWLFSATTSTRLPAATTAGTLLSFAVLTKETLLLTVPFMAWMAWRSYRGPTRKMALASFLLTFFLISSFYPLFAMLRGELLPGAGHVSLWEGVVFQLFDRPSSGSVFEPGSNAHVVANGWLASDGYLLLFGLLFLLPALINSRTRPLAAAAALSGLVVLRGGYLPVPYVVVLLPLAAMVGSLGLETVVRFLLQPMRPAADTRAARHSATRHVAGVQRAGERRKAPRWVQAGAVAALAGMALGLGFVTPNIYDEWWHRDRTYMRHDFDAPYRSAVTWLTANTDPRDVIVTDNVVWTDLVHSLGRPQETTVWFTKVGVDPGVDATITSWRDIDYFVVSDIIAIGDMPATLHEAMDNSTPVQSWGSGWQRIEIRQVRA